MSQLIQLLINFTNQYIPHIKDETALSRFNHHMMRLLKVYASPESDRSIFHSLDRQLSNFMQLSLQDIERMTEPFKQYVVDNHENKKYFTEFLHTDDALSQLIQTQFDLYWKSVPASLVRLQEQEIERLDQLPSVRQAGKKVITRAQINKSESCFDYFLTIGQQEWILPGGYKAYQELGWCPPQEMINSVMSNENSIQCSINSYRGSGGYVDDIRVSKEYLLKTKINTQDGRLPYVYNMKTGVRSYHVGYLFGITVDGQTYDIDAFGMEAALHHNYGMFVQVQQPLMLNGLDVSDEFWHRLNSWTSYAVSEGYDFERDPVVIQTETRLTPVFEGLVQNQSMRIAQDIVNQLGRLTHAVSQEVIPQIHEGVFMRFDFTDEVMKQKAISMLPFRYRNGVSIDSTSMPLSIGIPYVASKTRKGHTEASYVSECELGKQGFMIDNELRGYHSVLKFAHRDALEDAIHLLLNGSYSASESTPYIVSPFSIKVKGLSIYLTGGVNIEQLDSVLRQNTVLTRAQEIEASRLDSVIEFPAINVAEYTLKDSIQHLFAEALWPFLMVDEFSFSVHYSDFASTVENEIRDEIFRDALQLLQRMVMWSGVDLHLDCSRGSYVVQIPEEQKALFLTALNDSKNNGVILGYIFYKLEAAHLGYGVQDKLLLAPDTRYATSAASENETSMHLILKENSGALTSINTGRALQSATFNPLFMQKAQKAVIDDNLMHLCELMTSSRGFDYQNQLNELLILSAEKNSFACAQWLIQQGASSSYVDINQAFSKTTTYREIVAEKDYASKVRVCHSSSLYKSALFIAVRNSNFEMIDLMLKKHVVGAYVDDAGDTIRDIDDAFSMFFENKTMLYSEKRLWLLKFLDKGASIDYKVTTLHHWEFEYIKQEGDLYSKIFMPKYSYFYRALREGESQLLYFLLQECRYIPTSSELSMIFLLNTTKLKNLRDIPEKYVLNMIRSLPMLLDCGAPVSPESCVMAIEGITQATSLFRGLSMQDVQERIRQTIRTFSVDSMSDYFSQQSAKFLDLSDEFLVVVETMQTLPYGEEKYYNACNERERIFSELKNMMKTLEVVFDACPDHMNEQVYGIFLGRLQVILDEPKLNVRNKILFQEMKDLVNTSLSSLTLTRDEGIQKRASIPADLAEFECSNTSVSGKLCAPILYSFFQEPPAIDVKIESPRAANNTDVGVP